MRIAVYGGSFDPLHNGHVALVEGAARLFDLVLVVPAYHHALKSQGSRASYHARMMMLEGTFATTHGVRVSRVAQWLWDRSKSTYSYDLLATVQKLHSGAEIHLLVGSDILDEADKWHRWDDIRIYFNVTIIPRAGHNHPLLALYDRLEIEVPEVSSSEVRRLVEAGEPVDHLVPEAVRRLLRLYWPKVG